MWLAFLRQLFDGGHYAADPGVRADDLESDGGARWGCGDAVSEALGCMRELEIV